MTRHDYELLARALNRSAPVRGSIDVHAQHCANCEAIADALASQSRAFDRDRFLRNCGVLPQIVTGLRP